MTTVRIKSMLSQKLDQKIKSMILEDFWETKAEAQESLKFWVRNFRDQKYTFKGNSKNGYFECTNANLYLEITECTENQCMDEDIEN